MRSSVRRSNDLTILDDKKSILLTDQYSCVTVATLVKTLKAGNILANVTLVRKDGQPFQLKEYQCTMG